MRSDFLKIKKIKEARARGKNSSPLIGFDNLATSFVSSALRVTVKTLTEGKIKRGLF